MTTLTPALIETVPLSRCPLGPFRYKGEAYVLIKQGQFPEAYSVRTGTQLYEARQDSQVVPLRVE